MLVIDIYNRKSQKSKGRQVLSLGAQCEENKEMLNGMEGVKIGKIFNEARSASFPYNRPDFDELMNRLKTGKSHGVAVWRLNRLARNPIDEGLIKYYLYDKGYIKKIIPVEGKIHSPNDNVLISSIEFAQATQFSRDLKVDIERGMKTKAKDGGYNHKAPVGYINDKLNKTLLIHEEMAPYVVMMFNMRSQGISVGHIVDRMYMAGLRTKRGGKVHVNRLSICLKNPVYMGMIQWKGEVYDGSHKAIVSKQLWYSAQEINAQKAIKHAKKNKRNHLYIGIFKCGECGCSVTAEIQKGKVYYRCTKKRVKCSQRYIREDRLEDMLLDMFKGYEMPKEYTDFLKSNVKHVLKDDLEAKKKLINQIDLNIRKTQTRIDSLRLKYVDNEISYAEYQEMKVQFTSEKSGYEKERKARYKKEEANLDSLLKWLELMITFSSWVKGMERELWRDLLNMLGSNFILKDGIPIIETKTPLLLMIEKHSVPYGRAKGSWLERVEELFKHFTQIEEMLSLA